MSSISSLYHILAISCPLLMAHLSQRAGTKSWRVKLYPLGIIFAVLSILDLGQRKRQRTGNEPPSNLPVLYANYILLYNVSLVELYAFDDTPYKPHPIPPGVKWKKVRESDVFKIIDIFLSCDRKLNYRPNPPLSLARPHRILKEETGLRSTIKWAFFHLLLVDLFTLPLIFQQGLYRPDGSRNYQQWLISLRSIFGFPMVMIKMGLMGCYAGTVFCGVQGGWEVLKILGVGSGLWVEEEWPAIMDRPQRSSSMVDLWGRRYHQLLRSYFHTLLAPFQLPKPAYILSSFVLSAVHHLLIMSTLTGTFPWHFIQFFTGCGLVCCLEYGIYKTSGRKVEGLTGWVWTVLWLYVIGSRSLRDEVENGGFESFRPALVVGRWSLYPLDHVVGVFRHLSSTS